jgi:hypothetical protein
MAALVWPRAHALRLTSQSRKVTLALRANTHRMRTISWVGTVWGLELLIATGRPYKYLPAPCCVGLLHDRRPIQSLALRFRLS